MNKNEASPTSVAAPRPAERGEVEIDLVELFFALLENWFLILLSVATAAVLAWVYTTQVVTPMYEASSKLYVTSNSDSVINLSDLQIGSYLTNDYQEVFKTWEVHEQVNRNLGLNYTYAKLQGMITVSNPANTRILQITARSPSAAEATNLANEYAQVAQRYISETMRTDEPSILSVALKPLRPSSPSLTRNMALGVLLGLFIGFGIVLVGFILDDRIKTADDVLKYAGLPTLAVVPIQKAMLGADAARAHASKRKRP
ncbi:MAG TPA: Wzz/FepE/Etk N-terminal domain-containing protein [Candidatus Limnocylindria bacterium]|nr:Wzz/FepE/Etk N-terminal domain-containing protein [Candidatus Limnocylindria bacterium]